MTAATPAPERGSFEDGPYAGLSPYGIAVTALERILDLDADHGSWYEAHAIASEAATLAVARSASANLGSPDGRTSSSPADAATPGQAAYEVGDRVRVTGAVTGTNRKYDWVNIDAGGSKFTFSGASASPDISHAAAREPHAADGQRPLEQLAIAAFGAWINATSAEHALLSWSQRPESDRAAFRAAADAVQMMLDMPSAQPQPAPGLAAAKPDLGTAWRLLNETREQLALLQDSIGNLAAGLKLSADASRPSKKSQIEDGCAAALLAILDPR